MYTILQHHVLEEWYVKQKQLLPNESWPSQEESRQNVWTSHYV